MNIFLNEYFGFCFELNFELNHFQAKFNEKMNFQNVSNMATSPSFYLISNVSGPGMTFSYLWYRQHTDNQPWPGKTSSLTSAFQLFSAVYRDDDDDTENGDEGDKDGKAQ